MVTESKTCPVCNAKNNTALTVCWRCKASFAEVSLDLGLAKKKFQQRQKKRKIKKIVWSIIIIGILSIPLWGVFSAYYKASKVIPSIEAFMDRFFTQVNNGEFVEISDKFWDASSKEKEKESVAELEKNYRSVHEQLGEITSLCLSRLKFYPSSNLVPAYAIVSYVVYSERGEANVTLSLVQHNDSWLLIAGSAKHEGLNVYYNYSPLSLSWKGEEILKKPRVLGKVFK